MLPTSGGGAQVDKQRRKTLLVTKASSFRFTAKHQMEAIGVWVLEYHPFPKAVYH